MQAFAVLFALACLTCANAGLYGFPGYAFKGLGLLEGFGDYHGGYEGDYEGGYEHYGGCSPKCAYEYVYKGHCDSDCGGCGDYLAKACQPVCVKEYLRVGHCGKSCGGCGYVLNSCLGGYKGYGGYGYDYGYGYPKYGYGYGYGYPEYGYGYGHGHDYGHGYGHDYGYGHHYPKYDYGYGHHYPKYDVDVKKGYAGASKKSAESSQSSSSRQKSKRSGEWEQTVTTRVKKTVECERECRRSWTCRRQWSVAHAYWGKCSQCKSC